MPQVQEQASIKNNIGPSAVLSNSNDPSKVRIAIDAMGGDFGPKEIIPALAMVLKQRSDVFFLIYGDEAAIKPYLSKHKSVQKSSCVYHTDKMVMNDDKPSTALRASKGSGMRMAIESVKHGDAQAVVSAGNTGALMAMAKMVLKTAAGIHRPAIASVMPGIKGDTVMLDLGANVLVDAENLVQFALLGTIFARANKQIERPSVGLLNIGSEETKGPDHVRLAGEMLSRVEFPGEYIGFVEGNDITAGTVDVIVCDGYAGNVALKTAEGVGKMVKHFVTESFSANPLAIVGAFFAFFSLRSLKKRMDPRRYNGGVFLGLNGVCIKSHGGADALGFSSAVMLAVRLARQGYIEQVVRDVTHLNEQEGALAVDS